MRSITAMLSAAALVLFTATSVSAQAKPDFNGKWTREAPAGGAAAAGGGGGAARGGGGGGGRMGGGGGGFNCGMACSITVTGNVMKVERTQGEQTVTSTFNLDGTDSKNSMPGRQGGAPTEIVSKAKWDGNKLVIATTRDMGGNSVTSTQTLSIEGGKLTIVTTSTMEGATPQTATYTKG
jgi:hypothetical protein